MDANAYLFEIVDCSVILYKLLPCLSSYLLHSWSHFLFLIWNGVCVAMLNAWSISVSSCWVFYFCIDLWTHIYTVLLINICLSVNCIYKQRRMKVEFCWAVIVFCLCSFRFCQRTTATADRADYTPNTSSPLESVRWALTDLATHILILKSQQTYLIISLMLLDVHYGGTLTYCPGFLCPNNVLPFHF